MSGPGDELPLARKEGWLKFVQAPPRAAPDRLDRQGLARLSAAARSDYDLARRIWHANIGPLKTPQMTAVHEDLQEITDSNMHDGDKVKGAAAIDAQPRAQRLGRFAGQRSIPPQPCGKRRIGGAESPLCVQIPEEANQSGRHGGRRGQVLRERRRLQFKPGLRRFDGPVPRSGGHQVARVVRSGDASAQQPEQNWRSTGKKAQLLQPRGAADRERLYELAEPPCARALRADGRLECGEITGPEHCERRRRRKSDAYGLTARCNDERAGRRQARSERAPGEQRRGLSCV